MPRSLATFAVALSFLCATTPAFADKNAAQLYDEGVKLTKAGDARAALASFRASYDKQPQAKALYAIAQACARVGDGACAVRSYQQYLREGGKEITAKRKKEVDFEIVSISATLASLLIKSNTSGADVKVDDFPVGKTPLGEPVYVNGGPHKIVLVAKDKTVEQSVNVVAGESSPVQLDVKEEAPPPPPPAPISPPPEEKHEDSTFLPPPSAQSKPFPLVPWAITGGLAVGTAITGVLAAGAYSSFKDKKAAYPVTRDELDSSQGTARDLFLLSAILGAGTLVSASIAAYMTWGPADEPAKARVKVGVGPRGVSIQGVWQ